jgi:hypothetical protein
LFYLSFTSYKQLLKLLTFSRGLKKRSTLPYEVELHFLGGSRISLGWFKTEYFIELEIDYNKQTTVYFGSVQDNMFKGSYNGVELNQYLINKINLFTGG